MKKISEIQNVLKTSEVLRNEEIVKLKGGLLCDDKRRQRPGGGTTTISPSSVFQCLQKYFG